MKGILIEIAGKTCATGVMVFGFMALLLAITGGFLDNTPAEGSRWDDVLWCVLIGAVLGFLTLPLADAANRNAMKVQEERRERDEAIRRFWEENGG